MLSGVSTVPAGAMSTAWSALVAGSVVAGSVVAGSVSAVVVVFAALAASSSA